MIDSVDALADEFLKRNMFQDAQMVITSLIYDSYFTMNKKEWIDQENKKYRKSTEAYFKKFYLKFKLLYEKIPEEIKAQIIMGIKNRMFGEGLLMESITFEDWIKHVIKNY
jgi:hypothetical protein